LDLARPRTAGTLTSRYCTRINQTAH